MSASPDLLVVGGEVHTMGPAGVLGEGYVHIQQGSIVDVGEGAPGVPAGARLIDAAGCVVVPGLIDAHTHCGVYRAGVSWESKDLNELLGPVVPCLDVFDSLSADDPAFAQARAAGVTTLGVLPGSGNIIGGTGAVVKSRGNTAEQMVRVGVGTGGEAQTRRTCLKMALGLNPKYFYGQQQQAAPMTRMGLVALARQAFKEASAASRPAIDAGTRTLHEALDQTLAVRVHCGRADDILAAIRLADEFGFDLVLEHGYEAHLVLDEVVSSGCSVVLGPFLRTFDNSESAGATLESARILDDAGVTVAMTTDHPHVGIEHLAVQTALACRYGMEPDRALRMITVHAAQILGLGERLGMLAAGKDADLAVFSHHPFDFRARCRVSVVAGEVVYDSPPR